MTAEAWLALFTMLSSLAGAWRMRQQAQAKADAKVREIEAQAAQTAATNADTHAYAVWSLIDRAQRAENERDELHTKLEQSEERARRLHEELSQHNNGRIAARMPPMKER